MKNRKSVMIPHPNFGSIAPNIRLFAENALNGLYVTKGLIVIVGNEEKNVEI